MMPLRPLSPLRRTSFSRSEVPPPSSSRASPSFSGKPDPYFIEVCGDEEAEFVQALRERDQASQRAQDTDQSEIAPSSFLPVSPKIAKAKWNEFLGLLRFGYAKLVVNPDMERRAKALFQEICSGNPSFMPSELLQNAADEFAIGFVEAVDTIRVNVDHLPYLLSNDQPTTAAKDALKRKRDEAATLFDNSKGMDSETRKIKAEIGGIEDQIRALEEKRKDAQLRLDAHLVKQQTLVKNARKKMKESKEIAKELEVREKKGAEMEKKRREIIEQNLNLEFQLRQFVKEAEEALARIRW